MEVEIEFITETKDKAEILNKVAQLSRTASELGLNIKEIEFEEEED